MPWLLATAPRVQAGCSWCHTASVATHRYMSRSSSHEKQRNLIQICHSHRTEVPAAKLVLLKTHIAIKSLEFMTTGYSFPLQSIFSTITPPPPRSNTAVTLKNIPMSFTCHLTVLYNVLHSRVLGVCVIIPLWYIFCYHHGGLFTPPAGSSSHIGEHPPT